MMGRWSKMKIMPKNLSAPIFLFAILVMLLPMGAFAECEKELNEYKRVRAKNMKSNTGWPESEISSRVQEFTNQLIRRVEEYVERERKQIETVCSRGDSLSCSNYIGLVESRVDIREKGFSPDATNENYLDAVYESCKGRQMILALKSSIGASSFNEPPRATLDSQRAGGSPSSQSDVNQSIALAQQNQAKGDEQARKDRRKRNDVEYQASECLSVSDQNNPASFGSLTNSCSYKVNYTYCVYRPDPAAWSTAMDCEKQSFGSGSARAGAKGFGHMKGGDAVHWLACREPALALDGRFENGRVVGRCRVIGGQ